MDALTPKLAVVVPVFNHALTVQAVVQGAKKFLPVVVVDDGSTDSTRELMSAEPEIHLIRFTRNQGKGAALKAAFDEALSRGFTHAITIDADGQHPVEAVSLFARKCLENPSAFIIGERDLRAAGAPLARRVSNMLSSFWFRFETGVPLADTQCGFRVYPLGQIAGIPVKAGRYAYELEIMVRAAWLGIPLLPCPVGVDYRAHTSRLSHFHPLFDFASVLRAHARLAVESVFSTRRPAG